MTVKQGRGEVDPEKNAHKERLDHLVINYCHVFSLDAASAAHSFHWRQGGAFKVIFVTATPK